MKTLYLVLLAGLFIATSCDESDKPKSRIITFTVASRVEEKNDVEETPAAKYIYYIKYNDAENWQSFPYKIYDFDYEEGYEYIIKSEETEIQNPAQDQDRVKYTFLELISKVEKESEGLPF